MVERTAVPESQTGTPWPQGCLGAVSLTFDDGSQSQLEIALPILQTYGLLGTFFVNPFGDRWRKELAPWREIALAGHEVGNHTVTHPCPRNHRGRPGGLEDLTLEQIEADVLEGEERLRELIPGQPTRSFCYPCYVSDVGEGLNRQSYVPIIARHYSAARGLGEVPNDPALADLHYLSSWPIGGWMPGPALVQMAEVAAARGKWVIMTFHDFQRQGGTTWTPGSPYHLPDLPEEHFRILCEHLAAQHERIWTAPLVTVALAIREWRSVQPPD
jgi:peptidoglycan-N-acetylglucosamine deacetylase